MRHTWIMLAIAGLFSVSALAQKDELKTLKRIYDKDAPTPKDVNEYKSTVQKAETYLSSASEADRVAINYFSAQTPFVELMEVMSKPENQSNTGLAMKFFTPEKIHKLAVAFADMREYEKKAAKPVYTKDMDAAIAMYGPTLLNYAVDMGNKKQYKQASDVLYDLYLMNKGNLDNLYYAASYAVNAEEYDTALKYYEELKKANYSGETMTYYATEISSGKEQSFFNNKADRDKVVSLKLYNKPRQEKEPSKRGEIYKNVALILVQKGKTEEAKSAFTDALKENPDDINLLINEANLYLSLKDNEGYKQRIAKVLEKKPNDAVILYNIGVIAMEGGQDAEAEAYFKKSLEIDPNYKNAYSNLSVLKLKGDEKIVEDMNKITGTTDKDNKRYAALKKERQTLFTNALPYLEKAHELDPENEAVRDNLMSVYNFLEMSDKYKALKAKRDASRQ